MKKIFYIMIFFLFVITVLFADDSNILFSHIPYKSAQWKSKTIITGKDKPMTIEQNVFYKKGKMRTETVMKNPATGEKQNTVTIIDNKFIYSYDKNNKQGTKISVNSESFINPEKQNIEMSKCRKTAEKKGSEKINGVQCMIYEYTCTINQAEFLITEWRNKDGYPIRTVSKHRDIVTTVETFDLKTNVSLPDSLFKPDSDVKFMDMEKMMGEMDRKTKKAVAPVKNNEFKVESDESAEEDSNDDGGESEDIYAGDL